MTNCGPRDPAETQDDYDYEPEMEDEDDYDPGEECGRWINGRLGRSCSMAGTEFCDWECPYRDRSFIKGGDRP